MKSLLQAVYNKLDNSSELNSFKIYPVRRPATEIDYPYIVINTDNTNLNAHITEYTVMIDIYDRAELADTVLDGANAIIKLLERVELDTNSEFSFSRFENSGMIPEEDRKVWHWSADFSVRADKKEYIGG